MVATVVFLVGSVAVAGLLAVTARMHLVSQNSTQAARLASQKFDELMKLDFAIEPAIQISPANTLTQDVPNYFDDPIPGLATRRWNVQAGPAGATRLVTVRVITGEDSMAQRTVDLATVLRPW